MTIQIILAVTCIILACLAFRKSTPTSEDEQNRESQNQMVVFQQEQLERMSKRLSELVSEKAELERSQAVFTNRYRFINIEFCKFNDVLNRTVDKYQAEDYMMDPKKSTDRLLVFRKIKRVSDNKEE